MGNTVAFPAPPEPAAGQSAAVDSVPRVEAASPKSQPQAHAEPQPDLRLVIEEEHGAFVYKTIDRRTGEVVQQLPREDLLRLKSELEYLPGMVIDARG